MNKILLLAGGLALATTASAQVYATDSFGYVGALTANGWSAHSGAGNKVIVSDGNRATLEFSSGSGEDVNLSFPALSATDDVYASFLFCVPSGLPVNPDASGSYCVHFKDASFGFVGRFGVLSPAGGGDYQVAINASSSNLGAGGVWPTDLAFDTNYLIVISYDATTGESKLWVNPTSATSASVSHTGAAVGTLVSSIALRQSNDHIGFMIVDEMKVGNGFNDVAGAPTSASASFYGDGCYDLAASFYEQMTPTAMDLAGQMVTGTNVGTGYVVTTGPSFIQPLGATAVNLNLGDDDEVDTSLFGGTLGVWVGSNGWIALGGGNSTSFSPSTSTMLANPATGIYAWTDLQPLSGGGANGDVWYEESGTVATVTFDQVDGWNTSTPNTIQFTYDTATGNFTIGFGVLSTINPNDWLVGYSLGGVSLDPGPVDINLAPFTTAAADQAALALTSDTPVLGSSWTFTVSEAGTSPVSFVFLGDTVTNPGVPLAVVGAPGCQAYTNGNLGALTVVTAGGTGSISLPVPNVPALTGQSLSAQAASLTSQNALGIATSNGAVGTFGT